MSSSTITAEPSKNKTRNKAHRDYPREVSELTRLLEEARKNARDYKEKYHQLQGEYNSVVLDVEVLEGMIDKLETTIQIVDQTDLSFNKTVDHEKLVSYILKNYSADQVGTIFSQVIGPYDQNLTQRIRKANKAMRGKINCGRSKANRRN